MELPLVENPGTEEKASNRGGPKSSVEEVSEGVPSDSASILYPE